MNIRRIPYKISLFSSGLLLFSYVCLLINVSVDAAGKGIPAKWRLSPDEFALILSSFVLFEVLYVFYVRYYLSKSRSRSLSRISKFFLFVFSTACIVASTITNAAMMMRLDSGIIVVSAVLLSTGLAAGLSFYYLTNIFIDIFVRRFYREKWESSEMSEYDGFVSNEEMLERGEGIINSCKRLNMSLGILLIHCSNMPEIIEKHGFSAAVIVRRQIAFLISDISRSYEQWSCNDQGVFYTFIQCSGQVDFSSARDRYRKAFLTNSFVYRSTDIAVEIEMGGALMGQSDLSFQKYENAGKDFLGNALVAVEGEMKKI